LQQVEDDITTILLAVQSGAEDAPPVIEPQGTALVETSVDPGETAHVELSNPLGVLAEAADQNAHSPRKDEPGPAKYWNGESGQ
jgi:hypothetical protein